MQKIVEMNLREATLDEYGASEMLNRAAARFHGTLVGSGRMGEALMLIFRTGEAETARREYRFALLGIPDADAKTFGMDEIASALRMRYDAGFLVHLFVEYEGRVWAVLSRDE